MKDFLNDKEQMGCLHIQMAHDINDIIWENYYQINRKKQLLFVLLAYLLLCGCFWFAAFFIEYYNNKNNLRINFIDHNEGVTL